MGGPVLIDGTDSGFHGSWSQAGVQGGWLYQLRWYQILMGLVPTAYTHNGKIAVVGAERDSVSTLQNCGAAATRISAQLGIQADFFEGPAAVKGLFDSVRAGTSLYRLIHIVEETLYVPVSPGCTNGMSAEEVAVVDASADSIAAHVNRGGALFSQNQTYGWLKTLYPTISTRLCSGLSPQFTSAGTAAFPSAQPVDSQSPYHQCFSTNENSYPLLLVTHEAPNDVALGSPSTVMPRLASSEGPDDQEGCGGSCVTRLSGLDRYDTAVKTAETAPFASTVVISSGENFPDAVIGGALAARLDTSVLLTQRGTVPVASRRYLSDEGVKSVLLTGGPSVIDFSVYGQLRDMGIEVRRLWGSDRFGTARAISAEWKGGADTVVLASGNSFTDQVLGARVAAARRGPVLLVRPDGSLDAETEVELTRLSPTNVVLVGDAAILVRNRVEVLRPDASLSEVRTDSPTRMSIAAANLAGSSWDSVMLVTEEKFPDGLSGVPFATRTGESLILIPSDCVPQALASLVFVRGIDSFTILGGDAAIFEGVEDMEPICDP